MLLMEPDELLARVLGERVGSSATNFEISNTNV